MVTKHQFDDLADKYGMYASWAIWNPKRAEDASIIAKHLDDLKTSVVMVGLNVSRPIGGTWQNFHGRDHARKLMYAFNDSPYRGAYMTDLIKGKVEARAKRLSDTLKGEDDLREHIDAFDVEMRHVGVSQHALFILFGHDVTRLFRKHFAHYPNCVSCAHYSMYGRGYGDADWVGKAWATLEAHSRETRPVFNTLDFAQNDMMRVQLQRLTAGLRRKSSGQNDVERRTD
jgi:hypothetical protein